MFIFYIDSVMKNTPSSISKLPPLPAHQLDRITTLASNYARKFGIPLTVRFVDEKNGGIAWVKDDSLQNTTHWASQKEIFINTPTFQQHIYETTGEMLDADALLQVALHEVGHLYENAELKYRGENLKSSSDFSASFEHKMTPFVAKHFDALAGSTLAQKRKNLIFQQRWPQYYNFENIVCDIYVNRKSIGLQRGVFALRETLEKNYRTWAVPWEDWTKTNEQGQIMPRFAQFSNGMLRNAMTPNHPVKLIPEVEKKLKRRNDPDFAERKGQPKSIIQMASDDEIPFPVRLPYLFFLYEEMKKLWDEDLQTPPPQTSQQQQNPQQQQNWQQQNQGHSQWNEESKSNQQDWNSDKQKGNSDQQEWSSNQQEWNSNQQEWNSQEHNRATTQRPLTPSELQDWEKKSQGMPHFLKDALNEKKLNELEKALTEAIAHEHKESQKSPERKEREQRLRNTSYAELEQTNPKEREKKLNLLERTDNLLQEINAKYADVIQDLQENVFEKIISKRQLRSRENHWPVKMESGNHTLHARGAMNLYKDTIMGRDLTQTPARGKDIIRKETEKLAKGFRLTIVCDGSGSMEWTKNHLQKLNTLLILQTLKDLQDQLDMTPDLDPDKKTDIISQGLIFYDDSMQEFKAQSNNLTDEELMEAMQALDIVDGSTPLHLALQKITSDFDAFDPELQTKIKQREEIAVALILSDGESDMPAHDKQLISKLREKGMILCGIGITANGAPILELFGEEDQGAGYGVICEHPQELPEHMQNLLRDALHYL